MIFFECFQVLLTPGAYNFREALIQAYLAGRGNTNVHVVTHGHSALSTPAGTDPVPNIIGPAVGASQRQRIMEADNTLRFLQTDTQTGEFQGFEGDDGFHAKVIVGNPDSLKRTKTTDVAFRAKRWKEALEHLAFKTDIAQLIGASYVAGMVAPGQTSRFLAVNRAMIQDGDEWLGKVRMFKDMAKVRTALQNSEDNPQRDALQFFSQIV